MVHATSSCQSFAGLITFVEQIGQNNQKEGTDEIKTRPEIYNIYGSTSPAIPSSSSLSSVL